MRTLFEALHLANPDTPAVIPEPLPEKLTARDFSRAIVRSEEYRNSIRRRIAMDELPPAVEIRLLDYAYGKPVERMSLETTASTLESLSAEALEERAMYLADLARQLRLDKNSGEPTEGTPTSVH